MSNQDFQAVELFNSIKDQYSEKIKFLTTLKQEVTRSEQLDQGQKSALRIQIESILIDINEEIFAISEELSAAFQMTKSEQNSKELLHKAREFEQKKISLLSKLRQSISNNPSTHLIKSELEPGLSPPSKESNLMHMIRKYSNSNERMKKSPDYLNIKNKGHESVETFGNISSPSQVFKMRNQEVKKYPTPLRNRANLETPDLLNKRSNSRNSKSSKLVGDNRSSRRSISKQSLNTKNALNQIYSLKKPKNKRNIPKLLPKFSGCGPGGINGSLMVLNREQSEAAIQTMDQRKSNPIIQSLSLKKQNSYQELQKKQQILQVADKNLKKARQETYKINRPNSSLTKQRSSSALSHHEEKHNQSMMASFENSFSRKKEPISFKEQPIFLKKERLTETSEAVVQFSRDFDLMRKKFGEMHTNMSEYQESIKTLNKQVSQLKDENLKLNSDIKVIRNEHSEMLHTVYKLEQKNQMLIRENDGLREHTQVDLPRQRTFQQIIESPFSSVMQKRTTGAFPTIQNSKTELVSPEVRSHKVITFMSNESEVKNQNENENENENEEEQLSDWVLQRLQGLKA